MVRSSTIRIAVLLGCFAASGFAVAQEGVGQKLTGTPCPAATGPAEDPTYSLRKLAFEEIKAGHSEAARALMRCAIRANPKDLIALRQAVYLDLAAGDEPGASEDIDSLRALDASSAQFEAQQGYIFAKQKRYREARSAFQRAIAFGDAAITEQAERAIDVLDEEDPSRSASFSVDGQYLNRFDDGIVDASARFYQRLGSRGPVRAYLNARLLRDTASGVGPLPQIFSDNAFLGGVGLLFQPRGAHYSVTAEANEAYVFFAHPGTSTGAGRAATVPDFRVVGGYFQSFRRAGSRFAVEGNGSVGFYSRYQRDAIAYLQPRESYDLVVRGPVRVAPFFQQSLALDTNQQFFNNTAELIPGVQFALAAVPAVTLRTEYVRGFYLPLPTNSVNPYGLTYSDFRVRLLFGKSVTLHSGASER